MTSQTDQIKKWKEWLQIIGQEIGSLLMAKTIHEYLWTNVVDNNDELKKKHDLFFDWLKTNYATRITIEIRRLTDRRTDVISLRSLLEDIYSKPDIISREWFVAQYSDEFPFERDIPNHDYNRFADSSRDQYLSTSKIENDIRLLEDQTEKIVRFANKFIAHHDRKQGQHTIPTYEEAYSVIKQIDDLYCKYYLLLNQGGMTSREPVIQYDWWDVFTVPWLKTYKEKC
jgi:hypothetical protein